MGNEILIITDFSSQILNSYIIFSRPNFFKWNRNVPCNNAILPSGSRLIRMINAFVRLTHRSNTIWKYNNNKKKKFLIRRLRLIGSKSETGKNVLSMALETRTDRQSKYPIPMSTDGHENNIPNVANSPCNNIVYFLRGPERVTQIAVRSLHRVFRFFIGSRETCPCHKFYNCLCLKFDHRSRFVWFFR